MHKVLGYQPRRDEQGHFRRYCNLFLRIGHREPTVLVQARVCEYAHLQWVSKIRNNVTFENGPKKRAMLPWKGKEKERTKANMSTVRQEQRQTKSRSRKMNIQMSITDFLNTLVWRGSALTGLENRHDTTCSCLPFVTWDPPSTTHTYATLSCPQRKLMIVQLLIPVQLFPPKLSSPSVRGEPLQQYRTLRYVHFTAGDGSEMRVNFEVADATSPIFSVKEGRVMNVFKHYGGEKDHPRRCKFWMKKRLQSCARENGANVLDTKTSQGLSAQYMKPVISNNKLERALSHATNQEERKRTWKLRSTRKTLTCPTERLETACWKLRADTARADGTRGDTLSVQSVARNLRGDRNSTRRKSQWSSWTTIAPRTTMSEGKSWPIFESRFLTWSDRCA